MSANLDTAHLTPEERGIAARGAGCIRVQLTTSERDTLLATVAELRQQLEQRVRRCAEICEERSREAEFVGPMYTAQRCAEKIRAEYPEAFK